MEKLKERIVLAGRAISKLGELASQDEWTEIQRDAMIQRFEFSFELMWKTAKDYLQVEEGIDAASPKKVIRSCREIGMLDLAQTETLLQMADDRNLTTHTYDEAFAEAMAVRIKAYADVLKTWHEAICNA